VQQHRVADLVAIGRRVMRESREERLSLLAAAVAYYGFVSIVPLLLLAVAVGSAVAGVALTEAALTLVGGFLTSSGETLVRDVLLDSAGRAPATIVGVLLLAWSGSKLFRGLDTAFSAIYGAGTDKSLPDQLLDAGAALLGLAVATAAAAGIGLYLPSLEALQYGSLVSGVLLLLALALAFLPIYVVFPDAGVSSREALPGATFAAVGWTLLVEAFRIYTVTLNDFRLYGVLGAAVLLGTFLYLGATIIMVGAVLNAVLAGRTDDDVDSETEVERPAAAPDVTELAREVRALRLEMDAKTVSRGELESELKGYVRRRLRRGQARGWGPYLVLLYGTAMTVGAFYFLDGGWAIGAMLVVWLSTLGLYVLMLLVGVGIKGAGVPGALYDWVRRDDS
jgi:YihY family inner membrane protein